MRAVIQRVKKATITINQKTKKEIKEGLLILLAVSARDSEEDALLLTKKIANLRIFRDENDKMNRSILDIGGEAMVVSNFTLYADCSHGRRPSFIMSAKPKKAEELYNYFLINFRSEEIKRIVTGEFGADMDIDFVNQGPVTIILDSNDLKKVRT